MVNCFYTVMNHENDVNDVTCCLQVVRIYNFKNKIEVYMRASYIVKIENNNFINEIKHVLHASIAC